MKNTTMQPIFNTTTREELIKRFNTLNANYIAQLGKSNIHNKLKFSFITFTFLLFSCNSGNEKVYDNKGIKFTIPSGWKISTEGEVKGNSYYVTCQKNSFIPKVNSVSITYYKDSINLVELLESYSASDKEAFSIFKPKFDSITECTFNGYKGYKFDYHMNISNQKTIYAHRCFNVNNKSVLVIISESAEDTTENKPDINKILSNLTFK